MIHTSCKSWYDIFHAAVFWEIRTNELDQTTENRQMAVENLPDVKGYATANLFVKHPIKDMWKM